MASVEEGIEVDFQHLEQGAPLLLLHLLKQLPLTPPLWVSPHIVFVWEPKRSVHGSAQQGKAKHEYKQDDHELCNIEEAFSDDDVPGSKDMVESKVVEEQDGAAEEGEPKELVPHIHEQTPVVVRGQGKGRKVYEESDNAENNDDGFEESKTTT